MSIVGGQKGKNKLPEPKNGIGVSILLWSCDTFVDFLAQIPFLGSDGLFSPFHPQHYIALYNISVLHTDYGSQILFLGSEGLFLPF
jgi:hypothetical protein